MNNYEKELRNSTDSGNNTANSVNSPFQKIKVKDYNVETNKKIGLALSEAFNILVFAIVSLVPIGLTTLFTPNWDWSTYATAMFWVDYLIIQAVSWYGRTWSFNTRVRHLKGTHTQYLQKKQNIQKYVDIDYTTPFIDESAIKDDRSRKIKTHKTSIKIKLIKIANKHRINNLSSELSLRINAENQVDTPFLMKSDKKYRVGKERALNHKINGLFEKLSDEWILNNIDTVKVRYSEVSKTILTNGYSPTQTVDNHNDYKTNAGRIFLSNTLPSFIFSSFVMFLVVPLLSSGIANTWGAWLTFLTKAGLVASSVVTIAIKSVPMFEATELKAISERENTLNNYDKQRLTKHN